jgi:hypothetical protein
VAACPPFLLGLTRGESPAHPRDLSIRQTERLAEAGIAAVVGSVGDSYDNTLAEAIVGLEDTKVIHAREP